MVIPGATVFLSIGCIVMLAMVVFRMAVAELGASPYTWTAVLTIALAGLALGSFLGGRLADRFHPRRTLSVLFALSSAACVLAGILNNSLQDWTGLWGLSWPLHVLVHVGLLLLMPTTLLAAVGPIAGKMASGDDTTLGRVMGAILVCGACGGSAGVVSAGFFLIPAYGSAMTVWVISIVTLVLAFLYWVSCWVLYVWAMVFSFLFLLATSSAPWANQSGTAAYLRTARAPDVLYEAETPSGSIVVEQTSQRPDTRVLSVGGSRQGTVHLDDATYVQEFAATVGAAVMRGLDQSGPPPSLLFLGSGGYVLPRYAKALWSHGRIQVVEPDPGVTTAAAQMLALDTGSFETIPMDPGACLNMLCRQRGQDASPERYDLICCQPRNPLDPSFASVSKQSNDRVSMLLAEDGIYVLNIVDVAEGSRFVGAVINTLEQTFPYVQVVARAVSRPAVVEPFVLVAAKQPLVLEKMLTSSSLLPTTCVLNAAQTGRLKKNSEGVVLTNDRAPVEALLAAAVRAEAPQRLVRRWLRQAARWEEQEERSDTLYRQVAAADTPARADAYRAIGRRHLKKGEVDKAVDAFAAGLECAVAEGAPPALTAEIHMDLAGALGKMNRATEAKQHTAAAIKELQTEVRAHPRAVVAWEHLGDMFASQQDWPNASDAFARCLEFEPDYLTHYDKLGNALKMQRRYDEAIRVFKTQLALLKKTGRKEAALQRTDEIEQLEYERVRDRR